jgi:hypothetical protein
MFPAGFDSRRIKASLRDDKHFAVFVTVDRKEIINKKAYS